MLLQVKPSDLEGRPFTITLMDHDDASKNDELGSASLDVAKEWGVSLLAPSFEETIELTLEIPEATLTEKVMLGGYSARRHVRAAMGAMGASPGKPPRQSHPCQIKLKVDWEAEHKLSGGASPRGKPRTPKRGSAARRPGAAEEGDELGSGGGSDLVGEAFFDVPREDEPKPKRGEAGHEPTWNELMNELLFGGLDCMCCAKARVPPPPRR